MCMGSGIWLVGGQSPQLEHAFSLFASAILAISAAVRIERCGDIAALRSSVDMLHAEAPGAVVHG